MVEGRANIQWERLWVANIWSAHQLNGQTGAFSAYTPTLILDVTSLFPTWTEKRKTKCLDICRFSLAGFIFLLGRLFFSFIGTILHPSGHQKWIWPAVLTFSCNLCSLFLSFFSTVAPQCCSVFNAPHPHPPPHPDLHLTSQPQITLFKADHGPKDAGGAAETCVPISLVQGTFCTVCSRNHRLETLNVLFPFFSRFFLTDFDFRINIVIFISQVSYCPWNNYHYHGNC